MLFVSFTNPHDPWEIPQRFWDRYRREDIDDPTVPALPLDAVDPHSRRLRAMCQVDQAGLTAEQIRRARHGYYAAISYLDERVGEVLGALRESGLEAAPPCCSAPTTARCWVNGASGTRCPSWSRRLGCR